MASLTTPTVPTIDDNRDLRLHVLFDFFGVDDIAADIVAIPGIATHPKDAFVYRSQSKEINWLSDKTMLPAACPKARILYYFYDSMLAGPNPTRQSFNNIAKGLLNSLLKERKDCPNRPLIFVSHCLGGLVAQRVYNMAAVNKTDFPGIYDSVTGLLSLGTPYHGASEFTRDLTNRLFPPMIFCFFEQKNSQFVVVANVETDLEFVVGESSGTLADQKSEGFAVDHFEIGKFAGPKDSHFRTVSSRIRDMVNESAKMLQQREIAIFIKTYLCRAYAARFINNFPGSKCHWVNASTPEQFELSYKTITTNLNLGDEGCNLMETVHNRLSHCSDDRWLMIVDDIYEDADQPSTNLAHRQRSLLDAMAHRLVQQRDECLIEIPPLDADGSAQILLGEVTKDAIKQQAAAKIIQEIGRSPLALTLAHTYYRVLEPSSLAKYFEMLQQQSPKSETARVLRLLGVFDLHAVPAQFVAMKGERDVDRDIEQLERYGMIEPGANCNHTAFTVPRLIRQCVQICLDQTNQRPAYEKRALDIMSKVSCALQGAYLPNFHPCALAVLKFPVPKRDQLKTERSRLLYKAALCDMGMSRYLWAVQFLQECVSFRQTIHVSQQDIFDAMAALA
ncbi:hypothetical protein QBC38DRAFT_504035 [Podospora fimiseda]|uniref:DUF676 domain-containing protein n=1 Tax=Podospora fimiseda TaxID=252190 RepID=A0AAN6YTF6_9PEZI|nr:hypothetical protein QBC38DRAFT_504035 [Podospora fimiseda]